jgi:hypothetical protein
MSSPRGARTASRCLAAAAGSVAGAYAACVGLTWLRYGRPAPAAADERDPLLDRFMPEYEIAERHHVRVPAPADATLGEAGRLDLQESAIARAIFRVRELVLGAEPAPRERPRGLLMEVQALGWRVLATEDGREIVFGAVTQPWKANVVFRGLPPEAFLAFAEPGWVKIAWTLRADPAGPAASVFRTETRVRTTDPEARAKFRWYWARFSPGIILIRLLLLQSLRRRLAPRRPRGDR